MRCCNSIPALTARSHRLTLAACARPAGSEAFHIQQQEIAGSAYGKVHELFSKQTFECTKISKTDIAKPSMPILTGRRIYENPGGRGCSLRS